MRIGLTKYGLPQVLVFPAVVSMLIVIGGMTLGGYFFWVAELALWAVLVWLLAFFRDPEREVPSDKNILLSPADGAITDIEIVDETSVIVGRALRIGVFLNIFDVHINRTPCAVRIDKITYRKGRFKNAMNPESGRVNESNDIAMTRLDNPADRLLVRQISGAIARRIVCEAKPEQDFAGGQRFGMIKFGSRTELYLPFREELKPLVKPGDKVKAGLTVFIRY